ncbi:Acidic fibroblast growth factor intracellular-binding protein [Paragonimus heterotremus]|uniref:Acidic fibroblast growth factor intracellular-binding protein n=1 Tax=Paragonimus heterotremus TaxID=100268 RepID=A0A8J4SFC8_9TREM|nr:Acidic fibroblast growth factor intracellular-binding protein [Paragonimus heterotremus]
MQAAMLDVTVSSPSLIDMEVFDFWIEGYSIKEARCKLAATPCAEEFAMSARMLETHIRDHYAQFSVLEAGLRYPSTFVQACAYNQFSLSVRKQMVQKYYSVEERLLRELVGRKLSNKTRRELSELAERCELRLPSCKRQFDNLVCVARRTEDLSGRLVDNIQALFLLPRWLSEFYAAVVFIITNRFEVLKRSLSYVTFGDLTYCAGQLMLHWSALTKGDNVPSGVDLDLQFFQDLKECKLLIEKKDYLVRHKLLVTRALHETKDVRIVDMLDANFKPISKAVISIACGLSQAREMHDLFLDIVEKIIEPMRSLGWPADEVKLFFNVYGSSAALLPPAKSASFKSIWTRFIIPFANCVEHLYHK